MKKTILSTILLTLWLCLNAQIRGNEITVSVIPDHKNWTYTIGDDVNFTINVCKSGTLINNAKIDYVMGPVMYENITKQNVTLKDGTLKVKGNMNKPGFYRITATAHVNGKDYSGACTAAFSPEKIQPITSCPKDFDEFWSKALSDARAAAPLEPTKVLLPEKCTDKVNVYQISFQNIRWGSRTYGILCVPKTPGRYPAMYKVPGAGIRPYSGDIYEAAKGCIVLEIGIHGIPVTNTQEYYDLLSAGALNCYWDFNKNDKDRFYYKRVCVGAVRGIDYIATLPEWDGKNIGVLGSSQGGFLTLVCAALDKRVTCYAPIHAALCDHTASLKGQACGWPHYFYYSKDHNPKEIECVRYYDGINFAKRITVPGWFSFGYNDDVVPPTSSWGTYNSVSGPKEIHPYPLTAHFWFQEQYEEWIGWIEKQLGIK